MQDILRGNVSKLLQIHRKLLSFFKNMDSFLLPICVLELNLRIIYLFIILFIFFPTFSHSLMEASSPDVAEYDFTFI